MIASNYAVSYMALFPRTNYLLLPKLTVNCGGRIVPFLFPRSTIQLAVATRNVSLYVSSRSLLGDYYASNGTAGCSLCVSKFGSVSRQPGININLCTTRFVYVLQHESFMETIFLPIDSEIFKKNKCKSLFVSKFWITR